MIRRILVLCVFVFFSTAACDTAITDPGTTPSDNNNPSDSGLAQWVATRASGTGYMSYNAITSDTAGNLYAVGTIGANATETFDNNVSVTNPANDSVLLVVKLNNSGQAQWATTVASASKYNYASDVSVDTSGNVIVIASLASISTYDFGNGVTASNAESYSQPVVIKYNSSGVAQWAKSVDTSSDGYFYSIATDGDGNIYVTGSARNTGANDFGNSVTMTGPTSYTNAFLVKYNTSGVAQWVAAPVSAASSSVFYDIAIDGSDNIYVAGYLVEDGTYDFGNSITANGSYNANDSSDSDHSVLVVKYNSAGLAQWAKSTVSSSNVSDFSGLSVDGDGNVYAVGEAFGNTAYDFGNGVTVSGAYAANRNTLIVKYNAAGSVQWASSTAASSGPTSFAGVTTDTSGNVVAVGSIYGTTPVNFGSNVSVSGSYTGSYGSENALIVKYNTSGQAQWAASTVAAGAQHIFNDVTNDSSGNVYASGYATGDGTFDFGNNVAATNPYTFVVKYLP